MNLAFFLIALGLSQAQGQADHVLVVINQPSMESTEVGAYYRSKREVPRSNVVFVNVSQAEEVTNNEYEKSIQDPVRKAIKASKVRIDYIVLTKGVPIRVKEGGYSVDALLAAMDLPQKPITSLEESDIRRAVSPYFQKDEPFSSAKFGFYLVTRLDGYTVADAKALVDHSLAAKPLKGPFLFDEADNRKSEGYGEMQRSLEKASKVLDQKGFQTQLDETSTYVVPSAPLMGYAGWGSNDSAFDLGKYRQIKFLPGSLCETFVSTSGRTFRPTTGGQSLIADLIANGVTGVKGYVSEPYTFALAKPDILFDRYTSGRNLAESFYAASMVLKWKDVVIGDPLCCPYKK